MQCEIALSFSWNSLGPSKGPSKSSAQQSPVGCLPPLSWWLFCICFVILATGHSVAFGDWNQMLEKHQMVCHKLKMQNSGQKHDNSWKPELEPETRSLLKMDTTFGPSVKSTLFVTVHLIALAFGFNFNCLTTDLLINKALTPVQ